MLVGARPRLMATQAAIERSRDLVKQNDTVRDWQAAIVRLADLMLSLPVLAPNSVLDPDETEQSPLPLVRSVQTGGAAALLDIARRFCLRIQTLGIIWFLTNDTKYRDRAKTELLAVCRFPDWAGDEFLVTAEFAFGAAIGFDWLYDALDADERREVAQTILGKAIQPGLDQLA